MNWVDLIIIALLAFSALLGFFRGLVREVLGVGAWIGAIAAAVYGFGYVRPWFRHLIAETDIADPVAFGALFLGALIVLSLVARAIGAAVRGSVLGGMDRTLGVLFGLGRGAVIVIGAYIVAGMVLPTDRWPPVVQEARALPLAYRGSVWVADQLPSQYRPQVSRPPGEPQPSEDALLHPVPTGRATGR